MTDDTAQFVHEVATLDAVEPLLTDTPLHVYRARLTASADNSISGKSTADSRTVRLFTVSPVVTGEERERIETGLQAWDKLTEHPAISTVYARGETPRLWLAVTSEGDSLLERSPLSAEKARSVVADIAEGFRHVRMAGHGAIPLEPGAVRVLDGEATTAACFDWPIESTPLSESSESSPYTPPESYASDERAVENGSDETADAYGNAGTADDRQAVFRLGAIAYYALTGKPPDAEENSEPLPPKLDAVVSRALHPDPAQRYATPYEFKRAVLFDAPNRNGDETPEDAVGSSEESASGPASLGAGDSPQDELEPVEPEDVESDSAEPEDVESDTAETGGVGSGPVETEEVDNGGIDRRTVLGAVGVGAVATAVGGAWLTTTQLLGSGVDRFPMFRYDAANTGYVSGGTGPTADITEAWTVETDDSIRASPVVASGTVLVADTDGTVSALDTADGTEQWTAGTDHLVLVSATIDDEVAYVSEQMDDGGALTARDLSNGVELWQTAKDGLQVRTPVYHEGTLYAAGPEGMYAFDATNGEERWKTAGIAISCISPAVHDETVYVSARIDETDELESGNGLVALDATDGSVRWVFRTDSFIRSSPAVVDDVVYLGSEESAVRAIDAEDGTERWHTDTEGAVPASSAVTDHDGGTLYVGCTEGYVYALDTDSGEERWRIEIADTIISSPAVVSETVYVGDREGYVHALAATDGEERWRFEADGAFTSSPAVASNTVFIGSEAGTVYALTEPKESE